MRIYRAILVALQESLFLFILFGGSHNFIRKSFENHLTNYMEKTAPKEYHDRLRPNYPFGCKRLTVDTGYYDALHRPNFDLNVDGIEKFTDGGIVTKKGDFLPFDVVIMATGFVTDKYPFDIKGRNGTTYQQYNDAHGGPTAYYGTTVPSFPNFYILYGPNTTTGHASVIFTEEVQVDYVAKLVKPVLDGVVTAFEVTAAATDAFNAEMERRLGSAVWTNCASWYRVGQRGKVAALWPGTVVEFWWRMRDVNWAHYDAIGGEKWTRARQAKSLVNLLVSIGIVGLAVWTRGNWESEQVQVVRGIVALGLAQASQAWDNLSIPRFW